MKTFLTVLIAVLATPVVAKERDRCPDTSALMEAARNVDARMGGYIEGRNVALGFMKDDHGKPLADPITPEMVEKKRLALLQVEMWALTLANPEDKRNYLCAIMVRRRAIDDADRELIDHALQYDLEHPTQPNQIPVPPK